MKLRPGLFLIPMTVSGALMLINACGGSDDSAGNGDGDDGSSGDGGGDGDSGGMSGGDGDMSSGDGDMSGGDGDMSGGDGDTSSACAEACEDDGNPCTEDVCNEETGECGIPRSGNHCDDGIYCNGLDTCEAGECTAHAGDPCEEAGTTCNEGNNGCECATTSDCPGEDLGDDEWGTISEPGPCEYDNVCDEAATSTRIKTVYECVGGSCGTGTISAIVDNACETRDQDGVACTDNGVFCDGEEQCNSGSCVSNPSTVPDCQGPAPVCVESLGRCAQCEPATFGCGGSSDHIVLECDSTGEWDEISSCEISSSQWYCEEGQSECQETRLYHPRDRSFDVPSAIPGIPQLERGIPIRDALSQINRSEFG